MLELRKKLIERLLKELLKTGLMLKQRQKLKLPERNNLPLIKQLEKKNIKRHLLQLRLLLPLLHRRRLLLLEESYLQKLRRPRKRLSRDKLQLPLLHNRSKLQLHWHSKRPSMRLTRGLRRLLWKK